MISFGCFLPHLTERGTDHGYGHFPLVGNGSSVLHGLDSNGKTRTSRRQPVSNRLASATHVSTHVTLRHKYATRVTQSAKSDTISDFVTIVRISFANLERHTSPRRCVYFFMLIWILRLPRDVQLFLVFVCFMNECLRVDIFIVSHSVGCGCGCSATQPGSTFCVGSKKCESFMFDSRKIEWLPRCIHGLLAPM